MGYLTEERIMLRDAAREFALKEVLPVANRLDPQKGEIPPELMEKLAELGYFGIMIPEEYGGMGLGCFEYCLVSQELSRAWMSVGSIIRSGNILLGSSELSEERRKKYLTRAARGEFLGALAMSEPNAGSDVGNISTRAVKKDDHWSITGSKYWCTFADGADYITVVARTDPDVDPGRKHRGLSVFLVEKPRGELPQGVSGNPIPKIGYYGWKTWELAFDDARVPLDAIIGAEGRGFYIMSRELEIGRAHTAARAIGVAQGAYEDALAYAQEREQFNRPIADFQAIRFKLAKMKIEIEAAQQLMYHVCDAIDTGKRCDREAAMVKYYAGEMAERVTSEALQIHGGAGYTTHFAAERYWRDARLTKIFEGTSEIQLRIVSDHILGKAGQ